MLFFYPKNAFENLNSIEYIKFILNSYFVEEKFVSDPSYVH